MIDAFLVFDIANIIIQKVERRTPDYLSSVALMVQLQVTTWMMKPLPFEMKYLKT